VSPERCSLFRGLEQTAAVQHPRWVSDVLGVIGSPPAFSKLRCCGTLFRSVFMCSPSPLAPAAEQEARKTSPLGPRAPAVERKGGLRSVRMRPHRLILIDMGQARLGKLGDYPIFRFWVCRGWPALVHLISSAAALIPLSTVDSSRERPGPRSGRHLPWKSYRRTGKARTIRDCAG
jgi:hypothetical protein